MLTVWRRVSGAVVVVQVVAGGNRGGGAVVLRCRGASVLPVGGDGAVGMVVGCWLCGGGGGIGVLAVWWGWRCVGGAAAAWCSCGTLSNSCTLAVQFEKSLSL